MPVSTLTKSTGDCCEVVTKFDFPPMVPSNWPSTIYWKDCPSLNVLSTIFVINQVSILLCWSICLSLCLHLAMKSFSLWVLKSVKSSSPFSLFQEYLGYSLVLWFSTYDIFIVLQSMKHIRKFIYIFFYFSQHFIAFYVDLVYIFSYLFLEIWYFNAIVKIFFRLSFSVYCQYINMQCLISIYLTNQLFLTLFCRFYGIFSVPPSIWATVDMLIS